jgi:hypothetical protein
MTDIRQLLFRDLFSAVLGWPAEIFRRRNAEPPLQRRLAA